MCASTAISGQDMQNSAKCENIEDDVSDLGTAAAPPPPPQLPSTSQVIKIELFEC